MMQSLLLGFSPIGGSSGSSNANGYEFFHSGTTTEIYNNNYINPFVGEYVKGVVVSDTSGNVYGINQRTYFKVASNGSLQWQKDLPSVYGTTLNRGLTRIGVSPNGTYLVICGSGGDEGSPGYGQSVIVSHINTSTGESIKHYETYDSSVAQGNRWGVASDVIVSDDGKCNVCGYLYRIGDAPYHEFLRVLIDLNTQTFTSSIGDTNGTYFEMWTKINANDTHIIMGGQDSQNVQPGFQTFNWTKMARDSDNVVWSKTWQSNSGNGVRGEGVCILNTGTVYAGYGHDPAQEHGIVELNSTTGNIDSSVKIHVGANDFDDINFQILDTDQTNIYFAAYTYDSGVYVSLVGSYNFTNQSINWARTLKRTTTDRCIIKSLKYNASREELDISGTTNEEKNQMEDKSFFLSLPADGSGIGSYGSYIYESISLSCSTNTLSWYSGTPPSFGLYQKLTENGGPEADISRVSGFGLYPDMGQDIFTVSGTFNNVWRAPLNVTSVSVVAVGAGGMGTADGGPGGGAGGGGLGWKNNISVSTNSKYDFVVGAIEANQSGLDGTDSYFITASTVAGLGGSGNGNSSTGGSGGGYVGDGGGNGGSGGSISYSGVYEGGGGGAGGYSGNGGDGGSGNGSGFSGAASELGGNGSGGAGGGGNYGGAGTGGGVRLYGQGSNGQGGGKVGSLGNGTTQSPMYGGGGAGAVSPAPSDSGVPGGGAIRIIWGTNRSFPSTNTADEYPI